MNKESPSGARVFFALWPAPTEQAALAAWQPQLHQLCNGRIMRADTLHATLVFVGDVVQHDLAALQLAAREVDGAAFELIFDRVHYWSHNRIVYAAPDTVPHALMELVGRLEQCLVEHRLRFDRRPYCPHVTLLRHAEWSDVPLPAMHEVVWRCPGFVLLQSVRDNAGPYYRELARFPLS